MSFNNPAAIVAAWLDNGQSQSQTAASTTSIGEARRLQAGFPGARHAVPANAASTVTDA